MGLIIEIEKNSSYNHIIFCNPKSKKCSNNCENWDIILINSNEREEWGEM